MTEIYRHLSHWIIALLLLCLATPSIGQEPQSPSSKQLRQLELSTERLNQIEPAVQRLIESQQIPGAITIIAYHGEVIHQTIQGYANLETKSPLKKDSIFRIYSLTKPITAVAIMRLYEQGYFQLDDPISNVLPSFKSVRVFSSEHGWQAAESAITFRHLLTHTSGLIDGYQIGNPVSELYKEAGLDGEWSTMTSGITLADYVDYLSKLPLYFQPGSRWHYGANMTVLARIVEVLSGQTFSDYLQTHIFEPLRMVDSGFYVPREKRTRLVSIYKAGNGRRLDDISDLLPYDSKPTLEMGDTGLVSTVSDYLRFLQMLLNGGELDGVRLLSPTTINLMRSNHLPAHFGERPLASLDHSITKRQGMGFGLSFAVTVDAVAAGNAGNSGEYAWAGAANTDFWIDPESKIIGLVFTQVLSNQVPTRNLIHQMTYQAIID